MAASKEKPVQQQGDWVYTPYYKHWLAGKIVRRKDGGMFRFPRRPKK